MLLEQFTYFSCFNSFFLFDSFYNFTRFDRFVVFIGFNCFGYLTFNFWYFFFVLDVETDTFLVFLLLFVALTIFAVFWTFDLFAHFYWSAIFGYSLTISTVFDSFGHFDRTILIFDCADLNDGITDQFYFSWQISKRISLLNVTMQKVQFSYIL